MMLRQWNPYLKWRALNVVFNARRPVGTLDRFPKLPRRRNPLTHLHLFKALHVRELKVEL